MKNVHLLLAATAIALVFASCENLTKTTIDESKIYGYWQESEPDSQEYMRFLTTDEDPAVDGYKFGYEWDEGDGVYETDLLPHGNGWFKWKIYNSDMTMIELMDNGSADIPKVYIVKKLTDTELQLQDKDDKNDIDYYTKIVKTKS